MDRAKAIEKIKKCLRLSKSSNPHEAAAALRHAQALMREHAIDMADVAASEASEFRACSGARNNPAVWEMGLANMVAACFSTEIIFNGTVFRRAGEYAFIGVGPKPEIASYAFRVLRRQARKARANHIRTELRRCGRASKTRRADEFCNGWVVAVTPKAASLVPHVSEAELAAIVAYKAIHYPATTKLEGRDRGRASGDRMAGFIEGESARLEHGVSLAPSAALIGDNLP